MVGPGNEGTQQPGVSRLTQQLKCGLGSSIGDVPGRGTPNRLLSFFGGPVAVRSTGIERAKLMEIAG